MQHLSAALERAVLEGLAAEWECASWDLPERYRERLMMPLFRLENLNSRLGYWSAAKGEIVLARSLVMNHPWDCVREVLFHEMAHQAATQAMPSAPGEPPHGETFQEACRLLRANPKASGRYETLRDRLARDELNTEDRLLFRIRKLMALAGSGNRHEAESAMLKAHELMRKHHVAQLAGKTRRDFISVFVGAPALRHFREAYELAQLLQAYYFVQGIWVPAYVLEKGKMGRVLEISGTPRNVRVAEYVHAYVCRYIDREWEAYRKQKSRALGRYRKTDFALGVIRGFASTLSSRKTGGPRPGDATELVPVKDPQLGAYMRFRYPSIRKVQQPPVRRDLSILDDGIRRGRRLVIAEGVAEQSKDRGKRLPGPGDAE